MKKLLLSLCILAGFSANVFSQTYNFGKEVEAKVAENRKAGLDGFKDVFLNYTMEVSGLFSAQEANNFDLNLMRNYSTEIISSNTTNENGIRVCHIQTFGAVSADRIKEILLENHADFEKFTEEYTLEKVIVPSSRFTEIEKYELSQEEFDSYPDDKKQQILSQPEKYTILK